MSNPDSTQRFLFDQYNIRGEMVGLDHAYKEVLERHEYPRQVQLLLGEFMAATALLASTIKFEGSLVMQLSSTGQVRTIMAECDQQSGLRAIARYNDDFSGNEPMIESGQIVISILPDNGAKYQGIINYNEQAGLSEAIEGYFTQSEQLRTRLWLTCDGNKAAGFMIQAMPDAADSHSLHLSDDDQESWDRISHLSSTVSADELLNLDNPTLLYRLFNEEEVRIFESKPLEFRCSCSRERSGSAVMQLGLEDARALIEELGYIAADCQFCNTQYHFNAHDIDALFSDKSNHRH